MSQKRKFTDFIIAIISVIGGSILYLWLCYKIKKWKSIQKKWRDIGERIKNLKNELPLDEQ